MTSAFPYRALAVTLLMTLSLRHCDADFNLTILHTNDVHARYEQFSKYGSSCSKSDTSAGKCFGGYARLVTAVNHYRQLYPDNLFLDGGDQYQGTLWFYKYGGNVTYHFMNWAKYDVMAIGNHEFDRGIDGFRPFLENVQFDVISSNINASKEPSIADLFNKTTERVVDGHRIGIVGYTTVDTPLISSPGNLEFDDVVESVTKEVNRLRADGVKIIIALGHAGFSVDKEVARIPGVDIVIGGHSNTFLYTGTPPSNEVPEGDYPWVVTHADGTTAVAAQCFTWAKYLCVLHVTFNNNGDIVSYSGNPQLLDNSTVPDAATLLELEPWKEGVSNLSSVVVGRTLVKLEGDTRVCRMRECNLGNFITDAMVHQNLRHPDELKWNDVSIAILNSGGIRASIERGDITIADVMTVQPFANTVDAVKLKGEHLRLALEHSVSRLEPNKTDNLFGGFLQVSGLRVKYDLSKPVGQRVAGVKALCVECEVPAFEPLQDSKVYKVIVGSFIAKGGDGYAVIRDNSIEYDPIGDLDSDVFIEYLKRMSPVYQGLEGRIQFVDAANEPTVSTRPTVSTESTGCRTSAASGLNSWSSVLMFVLCCCVKMFV